ncbi:MAG: isoprenylcysteine carboxylmethyltransferase family protein [Ferruginibacter sp.]
MGSQTKLKVKVIFMLITFFAIIFAGIFMPAQTIRYGSGWLYFSIFTIMTIFITCYLISINTGLIERRIKPEKEKIQKIIQALNGLLFVALLVIPGLDFNHHWSNVPYWFQITSNGFVFLGFLIVFVVFKQNTYLANNIATYTGQTVITTGIYSWVRHPMYSGAYLIILFTSTALGSFYGLVPALAISILIIIRALDEEKVLARDLKGYQPYLEKVHYRFIPFII